MKGNISPCVEQAVINSTWEKPKYLPFIPNLFELQCKETPRTEPQAVVLQVHHQMDDRRGFHFILTAQCGKGDVREKKKNGSALCQPGLVLSTLGPLHFRSAEWSDRPGRGLLQRLWWGRKQTRDYLKPEELMKC